MPTMRAVPICLSVLLMAAAAPCRADIFADELDRERVKMIEAISAARKQIPPGKPRGKAAQQRNEQAREVLADLAIRAAATLERAAAYGRPELVDTFSQMIRSQLNDTRWRIEHKAGRGRADAAFAAGVLDEHGLLGKRDPVAACRWFEKAADTHPAARYRAAICLADRDPERAGRMLREVAEGGHPAAQEIVGRSCLKSTPVDTECAMRFVGAAADAGRPGAIGVQGWMYASGVGVAQDHARAFKLYMAAAAAGDLSAQNNLAELYELGSGVVADLARAAAWYRQAADAGFAPAQFNIGRLYALGKGVPSDPSAAREWLAKALAAGIEQANAVLAWLDQQRDAGAARASGR